MRYVDPDYLYVWLPLCAALWGCFALEGYMIAWLARQRHMPGGFEGLEMLFRMIAGAILLLVAIGAACVFPPRSAWSKRKLVGPAILAVIVGAMVTLVFSVSMLGWYRRVKRTATCRRERATGSGKSQLGVLDRTVSQC